MMNSVFVRREDGRCGTSIPTHKYHFLEPVSYLNIVTRQHSSVQNMCLRFWATSHQKKIDFCLLIFNTHLDYFHVFEASHRDMICAPQQPKASSRYLGLFSIAHCQFLRYYSGR